MARLQVVFDPGIGGTARLIADWGADPGDPISFVSPLTDKDYEDLRWYLEDYLDLPDGGAVVRARDVERRLEDWGLALYAALFQDGDNRQLLEHLLRSAPPHVLSISAREPDVLRVPWELLRDRRGPFTSLGVTIRRQLTGASGVEDYRFSLPLRILLIVARPDDLDFVDPRSTTPGVLDALEPLGQDVRVDFCRPPTLGRMTELVRDARRCQEPYHVLHFEGHGLVHPTMGAALCFEKATDDEPVSTDYVTADRLGDLLAASNIPLVLLAACRSGAVARQPAFRSVASRLLEAGVGSVVAMSHSVYVKAVEVLMVAFYRSLSRGATIGQALEAGRAAMLADPNRWIKRGPEDEGVDLRDWFVPILYQRGADPALVAPDRARRAANSVAIGNPPGEGFPPAPTSRFQGRRRELQRIERAFQRHRAVVLHGMGGMGKTALAREASFWWTRAGLFSDGACFLSFERGAGAEEAVRVLGTYLLGGDFSRLPVTQQRAKAKRLFNERRVLAVWDNFESTLPAFNVGGAALYDDAKREDIRQLFQEWTDDPRGLGRILVTSRTEESSLSPARRLELLGLGRPDSLQLTARVFQQYDIDRRDTRLPRQEIEQLLAVMGDHPLSIELVMPHLRTMSPGEAVERYAELLARAHQQVVAETERMGRYVEKNETVLASLMFSTSRLSSAARAALPTLAWFTAGAFEKVLQSFLELDTPGWDAIRDELERTALVRVDRRMMFDGHPYLRFHPTLPFAAQASGVSNAFATATRFVDNYLELKDLMAERLHGARPRDAMQVMGAEEGNFRLAASRAFELRRYDEGYDLASMVSDYLDRAGRYHEQTQWLQWRARETARGGWSLAAAGAAAAEAFAVGAQGKIDQGIRQLQDLVHRLNATTEFEPSFQLAFCHLELGRLYVLKDRNEEAIGELREAAERWERLRERGRPNLAVTLNQLAEAFRNTGRLQEALDEARRVLELVIELEQAANIARAQSQVASLLAALYRYTEADTLYGEALQRAHDAGDYGLEGVILKGRGIIAEDTGDFETAGRLYKEALKRLQEMHDEGGVMELCNLLGLVELRSERLNEARAWFEKSKELAERLDDRSTLGVLYHNLGVVRQREGLGARARGNEAGAQEALRECLELLRKALDIKLETRNEYQIAMTESQLGIVALHLGVLNEADEHTHRAREIRERLQVPELYRNYDTLATIAVARGRPEEAQGWQAKRDSLVRELERRGHGSA